MNKRTPVIEASELAIDLAKNVFEVVGADRHGHELWHRHISTRQAFEHFLDRVPAPMCVGMETGSGAQAWGRRLQARGITVMSAPLRLWMQMANTRWYTLMSLTGRRRTKHFFRC